MKRVVCFLLQVELSYAGVDLTIFSMFKGLVRIFSCQFHEGVLVSALNLTVLSKVALLKYLLFIHSLKSSYHEI